MWGPSDRGALSSRRVRIGLTEKATLNSYLKYSRATDPRKERHKACRRVSTCKGLRSELAHVFKSFKKANMTGAQWEAEGARQKKVGEVVSTNAIFKSLERRCLLSHTNRELQEGLQ